MKPTIFPELPVLVIDDEEQALELCQMALKVHGITNVLLCQDSRRVSEHFAEKEIGIVLLDLTMPEVTGEKLLGQIAQEHPEVPVIIVTGANDVGTAVRCMKEGAFDYMVKPLEESRLATTVERAIELRELRRENSLLKQRVLTNTLEHPEAFAETVTNNRDMLAVFQYVEAIAPSSQPVLVTGETGVGKELIAGSIHRLSGRDGPFVPVNVAGLDDNLFSDTLFGHVKGAFTGADTAREGLVEGAAGGTLFLDEIGDLSLASQVKLLRLLQEREYMPLGSNLLKRSNARIIVATNRDLHARSGSGEFRKDLYYRLHTHHIEVPPLRERLDDLPLLLEHLLERAAEAAGKDKPTPPRELVDLLATFHFPGNIRELESMVLDAVSNHRSGVLSMDFFKARITETRSTTATSPPGKKQEAGDSLFSSFERLPTVQEATEDLIAEAIRRSNGNQTIAAQLLGITRGALNKRLTRAKK